MYVDVDECERILEWASSRKDNVIPFEIIRSTVHWLDDYKKLKYGTGGRIMTNLEKFIEIMNTTFNAGFTPENMKFICSPCGIFKVDACQDYECEKCKEWWYKEYSDMTINKKNEKRDRL